MNEILTYFTPPRLVFLQMVRTFAADTEKATHDNKTDDVWSNGKAWDSDNWSADEED